MGGLPWLQLQLPAHCLLSVPAARALQALALSKRPCLWPCETWPAMAPATAPSSLLAQRASSQGPSSSGIEQKALSLALRDMACHGSSYSSQLAACSTCQQPGPFKLWH